MTLTPDLAATAATAPAAVESDAPKPQVPPPAAKAAWLSSYMRVKKTGVNWREATHEGRRMMVRR